MAAIYEFKKKEEKPKRKLMFIEFSEPEYHGPRKPREDDKRFKRKNRND